MVSNKLLNELNEQVKHEFFSAHYYLSMAAYCADQDLPGFEHFFIVQAEEERFHAMKFFNYINDVGGRVRLTALDQPLVEFDSMIDVFEKALEHEKFVTKRIYTIMDVATEEKEYATVSLLNWFIDEQVEEESSMETILSKLKKIKDSSHGIFALDEKLSTRTFTPEA